MNKLDFVERFAEHLISLKLPFPIQIGQLTKNDNLCVSLLAGSRTVTAYYDRSKEKVINVEVAIKTKNQNKAYTTLLEIAERVEALTVLESKNKSFEFVSIINSDEPFHQLQNEDGTWIMVFDTQAQIITK